MQEGEDLEAEDEDESDEDEDDAAEGIFIICVSLFHKRWL